MANAKLDENSRPTLTALSSVDGVTIIDCYADPVTHRLLVDLAGGSTELTVGTSTITNGTNGKILYDNNGVLGELTNNFLTSTTGITVDQTVGQTLGTTGARLTKLWATDITVTNAIAGSITGNAGTITVADESADTTCFLGFYTAATGSLAGKTNSNITFNASTGVATFGQTISGSISGNAATSTTAPTTAVLVDQTSGQTVGTTTNRLTKLWATDITCTNAIAGSVTGNAGTVSNATFTTALTVNTGTVTLTGNVANTSVLTIGAGAVSVSGSNTGDQTNITGYSGNIRLVGTSTGYVTFSTPNTSATNYTLALPDANDTVAVLGTAQTWTAVQTFTNSDIHLLGSSTGYTTFTSANAGASNYTLTFPAITDTLVALTTTDTLTNKRITPRVVSAASYTTDTGSSLNGDTTDMFIVTAQTGALKFNNPSGTPTDGQKLIISVASSTTAARALTWDTAFGATTVALPTTTAATTATLTIGFIWSASKSLWQCVAVA